MVNKTEKLDARGLNKLQRIGTLPGRWIPAGELRDVKAHTLWRSKQSRVYARRRRHYSCPLRKAFLRLALNQLCLIRAYYERKRRTPPLL